MTVLKDQAIEIAREFIRTNHHPSDFPVAQNPPSAALDRGGFPTDFLGVGEEYWSLIFDLELPPGIAAVDPSCVIVLVDAITGKPTFFPVL